jgi:hypothetical protein
MRGKWFFIALFSSIIIIVLIFSGIYYFNKTAKVETPNKNPNPPVNTNNNVAPPVNSNPSPPSPPRIDPCSQLNDTYVLPDFNRLKSVMSEQPMVKDVPKNGKIKIEFYHFTQGCRIWDKYYFLSGGNVEESNAQADIEVMLSSNYADRINSDNLCDIIAEARKNGDIAQWSNIGDTQLMWNYKGMLKYRSCLGL